MTNPQAHHRSGKKWLLLFPLIILAIALFIYIQRNMARADFIPPLELPWTTPPDFQIVYLVADPAALEQSRVSPARLEAVLGVRVATSWEDTLALNRQRPIEALLIHGSAIPLVNSDWLAEAYRKGVVIAAFNVDAPTLENILKTSGSAEDGFASEPYPSDFFIVVSRLAMGKKEDAVDLVNDALDSGTEEPIVPAKDHIEYLWAKSQDQMIYEDSLNRFAMVLVSHLEDIKSMKMDNEKETGTVAP